MRLALLAALGLTIPFSASARAQIDLPDHPDPSVSKPVHATPEPPPSSPRPSIELPDRPRGKLLKEVLGTDPYEPQEPKPGEGAKPGAGNGLDLPSAPRPVPGAQQPDPAPDSGAPPAPAPTAEPQAPRAPEIDPRLSELPPGAAQAAAFILAELRKVQEIDNRLVAQGAQSLRGLEEAGRQAARVGLGESHAPLVLACARVLLVSRDAADRELVLKRLKAKLPTEACAPLLEAFVELDPIAASPRALGELLDHPQQGVRAAAQRALEPRVEGAGGDALAVLEPALASSRTDTRLRALELLLRIRDPGVLPLLLQRLKDPAAAVALRAAQALAASSDPRAVGELLGRAFATQWILRESAYALLAIVEREDQTLQPVLGDRHVDALLGGLASNDPFVSGACAAALAGIGFRSTKLDLTSAPPAPGSPPVELGPWLDRDVPHKLVRAISGVEFHTDFSSLQAIGVRRLALLSGKSFGSDGPAWLAWWKSAAPQFKARRAVIPATAADAPTLCLRVQSTLAGEERSLQLLAPQAPRAAAARPGAVLAAGAEAGVETLRLSASQALDFFELCEREGAFGAARLPGVRGSPASPGRTLEIEVAGRSKSFRFAEGASEAWFEKLFATALSLEEKNRWQRYPDPLRHASGLDLWLEQAAWWDQEHGELERDLRLQALVFQSLALRVPDQRELGIAELTRLYARREEPRLVQRDDLPKLLAMLEQEPYFGPRARALCALVLRQVETFRDAPGDDGRALSPALAAMEVLLRTFGDEIQPELARILAAGGESVVAQAAADTRPFVRATAAQALKGSGPPAPRELAALTGLLGDSEPEVQAAAIDALAERKLEELRTELLVRARVGHPLVRAAALEACGRLGGEGVLDALVLGLSDNSGAIKTAAARGLAHLGDPSTAPLLVALLGQGRDSGTYASARQGLLALGERGWNDLLRAVNSPRHRSRREAALLLSYQGVPQVAPVLIGMLTENPADSFVAAELCVLTCVDLRHAASPAQAWWDWWESVVHDDSLAWLRAALERLDIPAPRQADLAGEGTAEGARALLAALDRPEGFLAERARRELSRLLDRELEMPAERGAAGRAAWLEWMGALRDEIHERWK